MNLSDVLRDAGAKIGRRVQRKRNGGVYLIEAADNHKPDFGITELSNDSTDKIILLADKRDGESLNENECFRQTTVPAAKKTRSSGAPDYGEQTRKNQVMNENRKTKISKFLSLILRHNPDTIGLRLDENGWAKIEELVANSHIGGNPLSREELIEVVESNDKKRFSFDDSGEKIRAAQGHSLPLEIGFEEKIPPKILYHGTAEKNIKSIQEKGLRKMQRHHVHLSDDPETARTVGLRYGKPVVFQIDTEEMLAKNFKFFVSANGVWLVKEVPPKFLEITD